MFFDVAGGRPFGEFGRVVFATIHSDLLFDRSMAIVPLLQKWRNNFFENPGGRSHMV
jgi:hypothetical protein